MSFATLVSSKVICVHKTANFAIGYLWLESHDQNMYYVGGQVVAVIEQLDIKSSYTRTPARRVQLFCGRD